MRFTALVSLALTLAASSIPLSTRSGGGVFGSGTETQVLDDVTAVDNAFGITEIFSIASNPMIVTPDSSSANIIERGTIGSRDTGVTSSAGNADGAVDSITGAAMGQASDAGKVTSVNMPVGGYGRVDASHLDGTGSAVTGTPLSNTITHATQGSPAAAVAPGAGGAFGTIGSITGAATGNANGAGEFVPGSNGVTAAVPGTVNGTPSGAVNSLAGAAGNASGAGNAVSGAA